MNETTSHDRHRDHAAEAAQAATTIDVPAAPDEAAAATAAIADRYRKVAGRFTRAVAEVPADGWERPAPCDGWVTRDVVGHLVGWVPGLLHAGAGLDLPSGPSVAEDPLGAWSTMNDAIQAVLDDPATADRVFAHPQAGQHPLAAAIDMFVTGDVLVHTWDLARAAGIDETIDADEAQRMLSGVEPMDEMLRASGHYGPRTPVPDDADVQTKLLAFLGRRP